MQERVEQLETKVAFQEEAINRMTETLAEQEQEIYRLGKELKRIVTQLKGLEAQPLADGEAEPSPPHY